jgi:hypothetical protein
MFEELNDLELGRKILNDYKPTFLEDLLSDYKGIKRLPSFLYEEFEKILLEKERYEDMIILQKVKSSVYECSEDKYLERVRKTL